MKIEYSNGTRIEIPNWLVVVVAVLLVSLLIPLVAIIAEEVVPVVFG
jgi:hypothetical protein